MSAIFCFADACSPLCCPVCMCKCVCVGGGPRAWRHCPSVFSLYLSLSLSLILITQRHSVCNAFLRMCKLTLPLPILFSYSSGLQRRSLPNPFAALQQQSGIKKAANTHTHTETRLQEPAPLCWLSTSCRRW